MKFAPIVPIPMLDLYRLHDYHMVLAPMLSDYRYSTFYAHAHGHKILDNGAAEGQAIDAGKLLGLAHTFEVHEVIAPDVMHDMGATEKMLIDFCRYDPKVKVMAVLQATTWVEFERISDTALTLTNVSSVALPKLLTKHLGPSARLAAAEIVRGKSDKEIHCLGCSSNLHEARDLARQGIVRGIDSSAPVVIGLQGQSIKHVRYDWEASHKAVQGFWEARATEEVYKNLSLFEHWCESSPSPGEVRGM